MSELGISALRLAMVASSGFLRWPAAPGFPVGLTVEQRTSALATMFGSDAIRAAAVLYERRAEGHQSDE